jgi:hypothetical protein
MFVAIKMLLVDVFHIDALISLLVIVSSLGGGILISLVKPTRK